MKLKIGNLIFHKRALWKMALVCFLIGIPFGVKVAATELYRESSFLLFMIPYALILPGLVRTIKDDIERVD